MNEKPQIRSSAETPKGEPVDPFATYQKELNVRLSGKDINLDTYNLLRKTLSSLKNVEDPKRELDKLLSGKKLKLEDYKRLREIAEEIQKKKTQAGEQSERKPKKEYTEEEIKSRRRAGFIGGMKHAGHGEKTDWGWNFAETVKDHARKEMEAELAGRKTAAPETPKGEENPDLEALRRIFRGESVDEKKEPSTRKESIQQLTDAMQKKDVRETHRLSELLKAAPDESTKTGETKKIEEIPASPAQMHESSHEWDKKIEEEARKELAPLTPEEKKKLKIGFHNFGFWVEEKKDKLWASVASAPLKFLDKKGTLGRFFSSLKENFERDAKKAHEHIEKTQAGNKRRLASTGSLIGNTLKYGRTVADAVGWTVASPFRYVMMGGMFFARGAEAAKEARLKNEKVIEDTRINDIDKAAEEAWRVYALAQERTDAKKPSREDIEKTYRENIPRDILKRLTGDPLPDIASTLLERILKRDVERSAEKIQKKIDAIDRKNISAKEKQNLKDKILARYEKHLKDLDRMVTQYGTVDGLALGAKYGETAGKAVVAGMMAESLVLLAQNLWEKGIPHILSGTDEMLKKAGIEAPEVEAPPQTPVAPPDEEAQIREAIREAGEAKMRDARGFRPEQLSATVKSGQGIWHVSEQKLNELFSDRFSHLDPARKTFVIDAVKDEVAKQFENPDKLKIGQEIDFSGILDDKEKMAAIFERADALDDAVREHIAGNNRAIAEWASRHPNEPLTTERVAEIIRERKLAGNATPEYLASDYEHDAAETRVNPYHGVTLEDVNAYGSREAALFGKMVGLSDFEYRVIKTQTVGKILAEIPSRTQAEAIYQGARPGKTIDLPYFEQYDRSEFEGHMRLADLLRHYLRGNPHEALFLDLDVDEFLKTVAPGEGTMPPALSDIMQPETSGAAAEAAAERISDEMVQGVTVTGEDIRAYGSALEAYLAKHRLGMIPREWEDIKGIDVRRLLLETPDRPTEMGEDALRRWYEMRTPNLPEYFQFESFLRYSLLADGLRRRLENHPEREYLEGLSTGELVKIFLLQEVR